MTLEISSQRRVQNVVTCNPSASCKSKAPVVSLSLCIENFMMLHGHDLGITFCIPCKINRWGDSRMTTTFKFSPPVQTSRQYHLKASFDDLLDGAAHHHPYHQNIIIDNEVTDRSRRKGTRKLHSPNDKTVVRLGGPKYRPTCHNYDSEPLGNPCDVTLQKLGDG